MAARSCLYSARKRTTATCRGAVRRKSLSGTQLRPRRVRRRRSPCVSRDFEEQDLPPPEVAGPNSRAIAAGPSPTRMRRLLPPRGDPPTYDIGASGATRASPPTRRSFVREQLDTAPVYFHSPRSAGRKRACSARCGGDLDGRDSPAWCADRCPCRRDIAARVAQRVRVNIEQANAFSGDADQILHRGACQGLTAFG